MQPIIQQIRLISLEDIEDKSKGDGISNFFVVIQTTWFIAQCLARWATHLPVTELEVVTVAYAVQNIFIYALWWNKPQSLSVPFRLFLEKEKEVPPKLQAPSGPRSPSLSIADEALNTNAPPESGGRRWSLVNNKWIRRTVSLSWEFCGELPTWQRVPLLVAGTIFGAVHLIPIWLCVFPTVAEKKLWQFSAFCVTVAPPALLSAALLILVIIGTPLVCWLFCLFSACGPWPGIEPIDFTAGFAFNLSWTALGFCVAVIYIAARLILLVLPFTTLRSLQPEALLSIEWTRFIPHF